MKSVEARRALSEATASQWGLVTSAQATELGVDYMTLSRLAGAGDLVRLAHGVYRDTGVPADQHESLRAAWLAIEPRTFAWERLSSSSRAAVVSGESASRLHDIGELPAAVADFTLPSRKQTERRDVRYRVRALPSEDMTVVDGLPATTPERTIADLVEDRHDLSLVGHVVGDVVRRFGLDGDRLTELLAPLAHRHGHDRGDGAALLDDLRRLGGAGGAALVGPFTLLQKMMLQLTQQNLSTADQVDLSSLHRPVQTLAATTSAELGRSVATPALSAATTALNQIRVSLPAVAAKATPAVPASALTMVNEQLGGIVKLIDAQGFGRPSARVSGL